MVGQAGSPPAEGRCVQMISSVTEEDKLSEVDNEVNISCKVLVSVNVYPTCAKHFNLSQVYASS